MFSFSNRRSVFRTLFLISPIFTALYAKYLGYFVRTPIGFTLLIIIEIRTVIKELKKSKN